VRHLPLADRLILTGAVVVMGVIIGIIVTLHHRSLPPWGVIAALLVVTAWGVGLRLTTPGRGATLAGLLAMLTAQFVLAAGSQTSIIVGAGALGYVLTLGSVLVAVVALAWPEVPSQSKPVN
jgi:hypothetical protein